MALQSLDSATASTNPAYTAFADERTPIVAARDSAWRALREAREQAVALRRTVPARGADSALAKQLAQAQAQVIESEQKLTQLERRLSDVDAAFRKLETQASLKTEPETSQSENPLSTTSDIRSPSEERLRRSEPAGQLAGRATTSQTSRADGVGASSRLGSGRAATPQIRVAAQKLKSAQGAYQRSSKSREDERIDITSQLKKTGLLVVGFALWIATVSDLLSIIDFGWLVSWIIPVVSWFMVRRINAIMKTPDRIAKAMQRLSRQERLVRQRLAPLLSATERSKLGAQTAIGNLFSGATSYVSTWIRDSIITQLVELIPVVSAILPLYLGQVVKMIINQNIEYQKVKKLMPDYEHALATVDKLERLEIEQLDLRVMALAGQQRVERTQLSEEPVENLALRRTPAVTDIARPGVAPTIRPIQQRPAPIATVPMRDVTAAA